MVEQEVLPLIADAASVKVHEARSASSGAGAGIAEATAAPAPKSRTAKLGIILKGSQAFEAVKIRQKTRSKDDLALGRHKTGVLPSSLYT